MPAIADSVVAPDSRPRRRFCLTRRKLIVCALLVPVLLVAAEAGRVLLGGNFHTVLPGLVYRGAQPSAANIETLVKDYHIKTVVNLRGCGHPNDWYVRESRAVQDLDIAQEDVCLSSARLPASHEVRRLVHVLERAEYPIYLHCWRGSDRTGLAATMVLLLKTDASLAEARRQLSVRYGHLSFGKTGQLDVFFDQYEHWLSEHKLTHAKEVFRRWAVEEYRGAGSHRIESAERVSGPPRLGRPIVYQLRLRNTSRDTWHFQTHSVAGVHLGYRLWDEREREVGGGRAALFEADVPPGQTIDVTVVVSPIHQPGRYRLVIDMAKGYYFWFFQTGAEPLEEDLDVRE
jgi:rhodanese/phosphatase family protein